MSELTPEQQAAADAATGQGTPPDPAAEQLAQPAVDEPAPPADHPAEPAPPADHPAEPAPPEEQSQAPAETQQPQAATFGGATPDTRVEAATKAASDPGFVVAKPLLTTGAYGHDVAVLTHLLAAAGYPNAVAAGLEAPMLTDEVMRQVRAFQEEKGIDPTAAQAGVDGGDPSGPSGPPLVRKDHEGIVDWRTWGALYEAAGDDVAEEVTVWSFGLTGKQANPLRYPKGSFA